MALLYTTILSVSLEHDGQGRESLTNMYGHMDIWSLNRYLYLYHYNKIPSPPSSFIASFFPLIVGFSGSQTQPEIHPCPMFLLVTSQVPPPSTPPPYQSPRSTDVLLHAVTHSPHLYIYITIRINIPKHLPYYCIDNFTLTIVLIILH